MNDHRQRIGRRIREIRGTLSLTQQELAERTGIQQCHIARIEAGKYSVGLDVLQRIADVFGMNVDFIKK